jgi:hypothetical protein
MYHGPDRNPVIVIPGLLGSRLVTAGDQRVVWGAFDRQAADPAKAEDLRLIALPIDGEADAAANIAADSGAGRRGNAIRAGGGDDAIPEVRPAGVLETLHVDVLGVPLDVRAYAEILATLGAGGYRDPALGLGGAVDYGSDHFTCFQFDYDWRQDNVLAARRLAAFIRERKAAVRAEYRERFGVDRPDLKFDIVAHSMGGLVLRYYLMYGEQDLPADGSLPELTWEGARHVGRVVLVGTPNAGAPEALRQLVEGRQIGPLLPYYAPGVIGTWPSTYQLLPRPRHKTVVWDGDPERAVDLYDAALWQRLGWGLASRSQDATIAALLPATVDAAQRHQRALAYQALALQRARSFHAALDRPDQRMPPGTELFLVVGDGIATTTRLSVDSRTGAVRVIEQGEGDETVPRRSVLLDERTPENWTPTLRSPLDTSAVLLLPAEHVYLTQSVAFRDNVLFWLLEQPRPGADVSAAASSASNAER